MHIEVLNPEEVQSVVVNQTGEQYKIIITTQSKWVSYDAYRLYKYSNPDEDYEEIWLGNGEKIRVYGLPSWPSTVDQEKDQIIITISSETLWPTKTLARWDR